MAAGKKRVKKKELVTKSELHRALNKAIETKYYYLNSGTTYDFSGSLFAITNGFTQGSTGVGTREGDRITPLHLHMKGFASLADTTNWVRIVILRWKQDYADLTAVNQILETVGSTYAPLSMYVKEPENRARFEVLADRLFNLHSSEPQKAFDIRIPAKKLKKPVQYVAGTSGGNGQLVGVIISDSGAAAHPGVSFELMLRYKDG